MLRRSGICRRFVASTRGVAAIEFAIIMPVLLIMLLATFDAGRAIAIYMKVRAATYTLAAITNQYSKSTPIQSTDMQAITGATAFGPCCPHRSFSGSLASGGIALRVGHPRRRSPPNPHEGDARADRVQSFPARRRLSSKRAPC